MSNKLSDDSTKNSSIWMKWIWISIHLLTQETNRKSYPTNPKILKVLKNSNRSQT